MLALLFLLAPVLDKMNERNKAHLTLTSTINDSLADISLLHVDEARLVDTGTPQWYLPSFLSRAYICVLVFV